MVILKTIYYLTILTTVTIILINFILIDLSVHQTFNKEKDYQKGVKKIVAYSLLKQIEIESEEFVCEGQLKFSNYNVINGSEVHNESYYNTGWGDDTTWIKIHDTNLYVSTVNLDKRLDPYHYVRIVGMVKGHWNQTLYCQVPTSHDTYTITRSIVQPIWSHTWDTNDTSMYFNPVMLSCRIPMGTRPLSVSLSTTPCSQPTEKNIFKLLRSNTKDKNNTFTLCVKPLDFLKDISKRLIQWIEINKILGAEKIEIYVKKVKKNVWSVLKW